MHRPFLTLCLLMAVGPAAPLTAQEPPAGEEDAADSREYFDRLMSALDHQDPSIRQRAVALFANAGPGANRYLAEQIVNPERSRLESAKAAVALIFRLNEVRPPNGEYDLAAKGSADLAPLIDYLAAHIDDLPQTRPAPQWKLAQRGSLVFVPAAVRFDGWRWYLAAEVLDQADPSLLSAEMNVYVRALSADDPMKNLAAVKTLFHLAWQMQLHRQRAEYLTAAGADASEDARLADAARQKLESSGAGAARDGLWSLLLRPHRPLTGVYLREWNIVEGAYRQLRYNTTINQDRVAYTSDLEVYERYVFRDPESGEIVGQPAQRMNYYIHDELLILDTLYRLGADEQRLRATLSLMAGAGEHESSRVEAARQLSRLGPQGRREASELYAEVLRDVRSRLVRDLIEIEDPAFRQRQVEAQFGVLGVQGSATIGALSEGLAGGESEFRRRAAMLLRAIYAGIQADLAGGSVSPRDRAAARAAVASSLRALTAAIDVEQLSVPGDVLEDIRQQRINTMQTALDEGEKSLDALDGREPPKE